jgi:flagellar hook-basal body complex protein FliE
MAKPKKKNTTKTPKKIAKAAQKLIQPAGLAAERQAELLALPKSYERSIDIPVSQCLQESRELEEVLKLYGVDLSEKGDLTKEARDTLKLRRAVLEQAENLWFGFRLALTPEEKRQARQDAEDLKRDLVAALRFFLRNDQELQRKVSAIQEGSGLADLLDDLSKLADLTEQHQAALSKAEYPQKQSPATASSQARTLAETLGTTVAIEKASQTAAEAINLRNRAFWSLRELMDEARATGRYVFRKKPKLLVLFRSSKYAANANGKTEVTATPPASIEK